MAQSHPSEKQITSLTNQLELLDLYIKVVDQQLRMFILSRLKQILLQTPNKIFVSSSYLFDANWAYQEFLFFSLKRNDINKKQIVPQLKLLYYVVSLRIKFWFTEDDLQQFFRKIFTFLQQQQRSAFHCLDFFVEFIDAFQNQDVRDQIDFQTNKKILHYRMTRCTIGSMDSLNFKTKNLFAYRDSRRLVKQNCYQRKDRQINSKIQPKVSKKIQAYILNKGLNRMITIANSFLNRSVIVNQNYEFEDDSFPYLIKVSHQKIVKILNLLHKSFTYDFYSTQKTDQTDQYTADRSPIILPTKFSKYSNFGQFQRWIKNLDNVQVYQYLFFITQNKSLKIIIVNILGDMLRIHMKYFKNKINYKTHLESIILPFTNILEKTELQGESNNQLVMAIGSNIQKLLASSAAGTFIGLSESLISNFIQALDTCIKSYILQRGQLNPYLIRYYVGFFVDFHSKILFQKNLPRQNKYLKSDIQKYIFGLGQQYQKKLLTSKLNEQDFDLYFQIFKIYKPKATLKQQFFAQLTEEQTIESIMINCTSKFIHFLSLYQSCVKNRLKRVLQKCQQRDQEQAIRGISQTMFNFTQSIQKFLINQKLFSQNVKTKGIITFIEYLNYILEKLNNEQSRIDYFQVFSEYFNIYSFVEVALKLSFHSFEQIGHLELQSNQKKSSYQHQISHLVNKLLQQLYSFMKKNLQKYKKCQNDTTIQRNTLERRSSLNWSKIQLQSDSYGLFLQSQCENLLNLLKKTSQMFKILFLNQQNKNQQQHKKELLSKIKLNPLVNLNLKIQYTIMNQLKNQSKILQSINFIQKIHYVVIEQIDLHRENHINHFKQKQLASLRSADDESIYYQNQFSDQKDNFVCQSLKIDCYCTKNIHQFDLSQFLNCFNIFSYFQMLNENDLIKRTHEDQCQIQNFYCNNLNMQQSLQEKQHSNKKCQGSSVKYREFYSLNKMIKRLVLQMRRQCSKGLLDIKKIKLLETIKILLKFFRTKKHDSRIKIQIINECHLFLIQQIKLINNELLMHEESNKHQEYTRIITLILECSHSILTHMLTSEIFSNKINLLNQDLILIFNFQNCQQKQETKHKVKQIDISQHNSQCQQQQQTSQTRRLNQNQAQMFNKMNTRLVNFISYVIELIINFPNNLIQHQGFNQIRQALSSILVEIYYEFSAFKNIFLLQNPLQFDQNQNLFNSIDKIEKAKQEDECSYFLKVDESNIKVVIGSYNIFIKFVIKLFQFSIILPNNLISLSKYNQFFIEQIHQFIQNYFKFSFKEKYQSHQNQNKSHQNQNNSKYNQNKCKQTELNMKQIFLQPFQNSITQLIQCQIQFLISFFSKFQRQKLNLIKCQNQLIKRISKGLDLYTKNMTYSYKIQNDLQILRNLTIFPKIKQFQNQNIIEQKQNFPANRRYYNALQYIYHIYCEDSQKLIEQIVDYQKYYQFYIHYKQIEQSQVNNQTDIMSNSVEEKTQFDKQIQQNQLQTTIYEQESLSVDGKKLIKSSQQLQIQIQTQQNISNKNQNTPHKHNATQFIQKVIHDQKINCREKQQQKQTIIDQLNKENAKIKQQSPRKINLSPQRYGYIMNLLNIYAKDQIQEKNVRFQPQQSQHQQYKGCQQIIENKNNNDGLFPFETKKEEQQSNQDQIQSKQEINWYETHQSSVIDLTNQNQNNLQSFQVSEKDDDHELKDAEPEIIQIMSDSQDDYDDIPKLSSIKQLSQQYSQNKKQSL